VGGSERENALQGALLFAESLFYEGSPSFSHVAPATVNPYFLPREGHINKDSF
jgi:hypothetical protein